MRAALAGLGVVLALSLPAGAAAGERPLEFGPIGGYYDFDAVTAFEDRGSFGARLGIPLAGPVRWDLEFQEVYTSRVGTGTPARQVSFATRLRYEPFAGRWTPSIPVGVSFLGLDDSRFPDSYGPAWDFGLGALYRASGKWWLRADWMLRRQDLRVHRRTTLGNGEFVSSGTQTLWGRDFRVGFSRVF